MLVHLAFVAVFTYRDPNPAAAFGYTAAGNLIVNTLVYGFVGLIRWLFIWRHDDDDSQVGLTR